MFTRIYEFSLYTHYQYSAMPMHDNDGWDEVFLTILLLIFALL